MNKTKGKLYVIEGSDFSGKTTLINNIQDYIIDNKLKWLITHEPGNKIGSETQDICYGLRTVVKDYDLNDFERCCVCSASRYIHTIDIVNAINKGYNVICDRYLVSSYAYQSHLGTGSLRADVVTDLNKINIDLLKKNNIEINTIVLNIDKSTYEHRKQQRLNKQCIDAIESSINEDKILEFFNKNIESNIHFIEIDAKLDLSLKLINANNDSKTITDEVIKYILN